MNNVLAAIRLPMIISSILLLPFMALELINRQAFRAREGLPVILFFVLWLLPAAFILISVPTLRNVRSVSRSGTYLISVLLGVAALIFIAWLWGSTILDQMPCFLGVPNCD
jgi:hypothetical protein